MSKIRNKIGSKLARTRFGVFIIANSYIHDSYEWYRSLIYHSDYTLEEIREVIKSDDRKYRWNWLLARARATHIHCNHAELCEMLEYITDELEEKENT